MTTRVADWQPIPLSPPKKRSRLRMKLGREWHIARRRMGWWLGGDRLARTRTATDLDYTVFSHRTPLIRSLPKVDLWLQQNKIENLRIAIRRLDGIELRPGEVFSFWRTVGRPTAAKGYRQGFALEQGKVVHSVGGGLCQLTNLLFWTVLHSPLTVTERWRHSFDVFPDVSRTQPFGSGATCSYNYLDLRFRNDTEASYRFRLWLDETHLNVALTSSEEPLYRYVVSEVDHVIRQEYWGGYSRHNRIRKSTFSRDDGNLVDAYIAVENHVLMMYNPLLEGE